MNIFFNKGRDWIAQIIIEDSSTHNCMEMISTGSCIFELDHYRHNWMLQTSGILNHLSHNIIYYFSHLSLLHIREIANYV